MHMPKGKEITLYEREKIESWLKRKNLDSQKLNRDYSVIKREVKRNSGKHLPYNAKDAQYYAERRKKKTNKRKLEKWQNKKLADYVKKELEDGKSPDQIAGRLKEYLPEELKDCKDKFVSYEAIYDWIYNEEGIFGGLYKKLRRKNKKRILRFSYKQRKKKENIQERISIDLRPEIVEKRERIGDWETDSVVFKGKGMFCRLHKCENKTASRSEESLRDSIESLPASFWLTITRDNGSENALYHRTEVQSYFCDSYCSWQKGGVENLNGLIREYFPKRSNPDNISEREIYEVQERLNNRPIKSLNYLTLNEVIALEFSKKGL